MEALLLRCVERIGKKQNKTTEKLYNVIFLLTPVQADYIQKWPLFSIGRKRNERD